MFIARSPLGILFATICSIGATAFIWFVIVKPQLDTTNDQVNESLRQFAPSPSTTNPAAPTLEEADKLRACIDAAGNDPVKITACTDRYR